jgi:hypothetical protein
MNTRKVILLAAAFAAAGLSSAPAAPHAGKFVDIVDAHGGKVRSWVGQQGNLLFVQTLTGIEVFQQSAAGAPPDLSASSIQCVRRGDVITIIHPGGLTSFTKVKNTNPPPNPPVSAMPSTGNGVSH